MGNRQEGNEHKGDDGGHRFEEPPQLLGVLSYSRHQRRARMYEISQQPSPSTATLPADRKGIDAFGVLTKETIVR